MSAPEQVRMWWTASARMPPITRWRRMLTRTKPETETGTKIKVKT
jgi:hypothetical protein